MDNTIVFIKNKIIDLFHVVPVVEHIHRETTFTWYHNVLSIFFDDEYFISLQTPDDYISSAAPNLRGVQIDVNVLLNQLVLFNHIKNLILRHHNDFNAIQTDGFIQIQWGEGIIYDLIIRYKIKYYDIRFYDSSFKSVFFDQFKIPHDDIDRFITLLFDQLYPRRVY